MSFIELDENLPGITSLFNFSPETAKPLSELAEALLRPEDKPGHLTRTEREIIATYVSFKNDCEFCCNSHSAVVVAYLKNDNLLEQIKTDYQNANITSKFKALLMVAGEVRKGGKYVNDECINWAKENGATDSEIHDTVLIAASFSMFNRYVDGLAAPLPQHQKYQEMGQKLATQGYLSK